MTKRKTPRPVGAVAPDDLQLDAREHEIVDEVVNAIMGGKATATVSRDHVAAQVQFAAVLLGLRRRSASGAARRAAALPRPNRKGVARKIADDVLRRWPQTRELGFDELRQFNDRQRDPMDLSSVYRAAWDRARRSASTSDATARGPSKAARVASPVSSRRSVLKH